MIDNSDQTGLFIGGLLLSGTSTYYASLIKISTVSNSLAWSIGALSSSKQAIVAMSLKMTTAYPRGVIWGCLET